MNVKWAGILFNGGRAFSLVLIPTLRRGKDLWEILIFRPRPKFPKSV